MNLYENGPDDGGLMVLEGSFPLYNEFFETHEQDKPEAGWTWRDSHHFTKEQEQWFLERGCKWKKVEAGPGDVILWDSRCMHYGAAAKGERPRVATCKCHLLTIIVVLKIHCKERGSIADAMALDVCYKPAGAISPEFADLRKEVMKNHWSTSHDPLLFRPTGSQFLDKEDEDETVAPRNLPVLSERAQQLAGIAAY